MTDIKQRLQPNAVFREVLNHSNYGDRLQNLAADALTEIERLEKVMLWNEFHAWWEEEPERTTNAQSLMFEAWVAAYRCYSGGSRGG